MARPVDRVGVVTIGAVGVSLVTVEVSLVTVEVSTVTVDVSVGVRATPSGTHVSATVPPETVVTEIDATQNTVRVCEQTGQADFGTLTAALAAGRTAPRRLKINAKALVEAISDFFIFPPGK
jgi:hypothetical protein